MPLNQSSLIGLRLRVEAVHMLSCWLIFPGEYSEDGGVSTADTVADGGPDEDQEADGDFKP